MTGFVYKWVNTTNSKWYIGSHKGTIDDGYRHTSDVLSVAEEKYEIKSFVREILFEGDYEKDKIRDIEAEYLQKYDAANSPMSYNRTNITGPNCFSKAYRQKLSSSHKGNKHSSETRKKMSISHTGKKLTEKTKKKISDKHKGRTVSNSHRLALSMALKNCTHETVTCPHCKKTGAKPIMTRFHFDKCSVVSKEQHKMEKVQCPSCKKMGGISLMKRYHFENCND